MLSNDLRLSTILAPAFHPVHIAIKEGAKTEFWLKGGRGSTKSSFVAIQIILGIMVDPDANALALRKVDNTVRTSVFTTLQWAIHILGVRSYFKWTQSPAEITYIPTGQKIIMKGLDDKQKLKSIKVVKGYFKFLWFEEASEFFGMEEIRSVEQSVLRGGERYIEFITYNPPNDPDNWVNIESKLEYPNRHVHHSTYLDVPVEWLGAPFIEKAERLKITDNPAYLHEYMGQSLGRSDQAVMNGKWEIGVPEDFSSLWHGPYDGADWGFSTDPTVRVRCYVSPDRRRLYIQAEAFGYKIENNDIGKLFDNLPNAKRINCIADCSRPETISHVKSEGYRIEPCEKWSGSVEDGIAHLRGYEIIMVDPSCVQTIDEMVNYKHKVDKLTNKILADIIDKYNHCIDAIRYALGPLIQRRSTGFFDSKLGLKRR